MARETITREGFDRRLDAANTRHVQGLQQREEQQTKAEQLLSHNDRRTAHGAEHMTQAQMIEGTTEEVTRQMQQSYAGQKVRVFIEPEEGEEQAAALPAPPDTIRDKAHLVELLREGMQEEPEPVRQEEWAEIRKEIRNRLAPKKQ